MAIVSLGPPFDPMMTYLGNITGIVVLNIVMAWVPVKWALADGTALRGAGLMTVGLPTRNLWSLFVIYLFIGFAGALMNATYWIWISAHMKRNRAAAALQMILFFVLAMISVPLILGLAMDRGATWRWILVAEGGLVPCWSP
jgi:MFS family permease